MVKSLAEKHGQRATFMPKPFANQTGTGTHVHVSLHSLDNGANLFNSSKDSHGLTELAYHFMGGVLQLGDVSCLFFCPTVNSYKRLSPLTPRSGTTWSPNTISYTGNNRTHMIRIPAPGRFEFRLPDGAVNPYFLPAVTLALGLNGLVNKIDPGKRSDFNLFSTPRDSPLLQNIKRLPSNLGDAINLTKGSTALGDLLGKAFVESFLGLIQKNWNEYLSVLSHWEINAYLNC